MLKHSDEKKRMTRKITRFSMACRICKFSASERTAETRAFESTYLAWQCNWTRVILVPAHILQSDWISKRDTIILPKLLYRSRVRNKNLIYRVLCLLPLKIIDTCTSKKNNKKKYTSDVVTWKRRVFRQLSWNLLTVSSVISILKAVFVSPFPLNIICRGYRFFRLHSRCSFKFSVYRPFARTFIFSFSLMVVCHTLLISNASWDISDKIILCALRCVCQIERRDKIYLRNAWTWNVRWKGINMKAVYHIPPCLYFLFCFILVCISL